MLMAALFIITINKTQSKYPSTGKWINKLKEGAIPQSTTHQDKALTTHSHTSTAEFQNHDTK